MIVDPPILRRPPIHYANVGSAEHLNGTGIKNTPSLRRMQDRTERQSLVLWWRPLVTLYYFIRECSTLFVIYMQQLGRNWRWLLLLLVALALAVGVYNIDGTHQEAIRSFERQVLWCAYWVGLGILSSVGLGTGLHTFVLYLGPHIAKVALAAYECGSVDFPEPPYPSSITCPEEAGNVAGITLWTIMSKVRLEAFMWGAGTAIGELPPYFMARAARLSGDDDIDDDDREELAELSMIEQKEQHPEELRQLSLLERMKVYVHALVHKAGFLGILACASIPNPLFDLAGITCGHFLIPFWTFFGATLIGKAIIKMHIQKLFVIFAFSQHHADQLVYLIKHIPFIGPSLKQPFEDLLKSQREKLHAKGGDANVTPGGTPWLSWLFEKVVTVMIVYFLVSIVNSFAQNYHKRLCKQQYDKERDDEEATRSYTTSSSGGGSSSSRRGYSTTTSSLSSLAATVAKDGLLKQS